jgi:hypothetical protein
VKIATGTAEQHETPLPYSPPDDGLAGVTARAPGASGPPDAGVLVTGVRDLTGERLAQLAAGEADAGAAMAAGMAAEHDRRNHYETDIMPLGAMYGDTMTLPPSPLDPGVGSLGTTDPSGALYDPPRDYGAQDN